MCFARVALSCIDRAEIRDYCGVVDRAEKKSKLVSADAESIVKYLAKRAPVGAKNM